MVTRTQDGTHKITQRPNLHVSHISYVPKSPSLALSDPHWRNAMYDEYNALIKNGTWVLVPRPSGANIVCSQQLGIDCDENFSTVVKPATIRTVFSLALTRYWHIHQLDVKNAFLNGDLLETVYMHQPPGFVDPRYPHHVCRLQRCGTDITYLSIYVDDIVLIASSTALLQRLFSLYTWNPTLYRSLAGGLQYLTFTRPDLSYDVQQICLLMHDPREPHLAALKRILCYVWGTLEFGLQLCRQPTLSRSSVKAEYRGVANVVAETAWLRNLLRELHTQLLNATFVYCDNVSAVYLSGNPVQHQRTKHIEIDIHFVRDMVVMGHMRVLHVPSRYQYADIFTKRLPSTLFEEFFD
ncbi:ribonuclease H-like domain-containing protein [Tanacetum coccineum]